MSWEKVNLEDVIEKPISGEWGDEGNSVFVLRTTNFSNDGSLDLKDVVTRNVSADKIEKKKLLIGDTILEKSGGSPSQPVGRVVYFDIAKNNGSKYLCNNFTSIIRPRKTVHPKYLFWFLFNNHTSKKTLSYQNKTTGIINLQTERYIKEQKIPLPPLPTQQKIAAILDKADALRKKDQQLLAKYDELLQSIFYNMFGDPVKNEKGWGVKSLLHFGSFKNGLNYSRSESGVSVKCLGVGDFKTLSELTEIELLSNLNLSIEPSEDYFLRNGDLIFVRSNGNKELVGRCLVIYPHERKVTFSGFCIRYRPNDKSINTVYLSHLFRIHTFRKQMLQNGRGANIQNINQELLGELNVPLPPISLQNKFASIAQNIQNQKQQVKQQIAQSENLFQSLLQKAFTGQLVHE